jgi:hypothetical protein
VANTRKCLTSVLRFFKHSNWLNSFNDIVDEYDLFESAPTFVNLFHPYSPLLLDLVVGGGLGKLATYKNVGSLSEPVFDLQIGDKNPFRDVNTIDFSSPTFWYVYTTLAFVAMFP